MSEELEVGNPETFLGEFEIMDLSELKDKLFLVAISSGDPAKLKYIPESIHGVFGFYEMVDRVHAMWKIHLHHAKVIIPSKTMNEPPRFLDECTIDYIESQGPSIITEGMLGGEDLVSDFTCKAGIMEAENAGLPEKKEEL